jgi:hypothetical protein
MRNSNITTQLGVLLAVVGLVLSGVGGAMAAAPTVQTDSDIQDGTTITGFDASPDNRTVTNATDMTDDAALRILDANGQVVYENKSMPDNVTVGSTTPTTYYKYNISHDELEYLPVAAGGNTTFTVRLVNNTSVANPDTTNLTLHVESVDGRTVRYVGDTAADDEDLMDLGSDGIEIPFTETTLFSDDYARYTPEDVPITGENTTVTIHYANSTAADRLGTATSDLETNTWVKSTLVSVDGTPTRAYLEEAPDDIDDDETYAVLQPDSNDVVIHTGDEFEGDDEIDSLVVNANKGWMAQFNFYGIEQYLGFSLSTGMFGGGNALTMAGLGLVVVGRRREQAS